MLNGLPEAMGHLFGINPTHISIMYFSSLAQNGFLTVGSMIKNGHSAHLVTVIVVSFMVYNYVVHAQSNAGVI